MSKTFRFKDWDCVINLKKYGNDRTAICLVDSIDRSAIATATVNLPHIELKQDEVLIKTWSENEGLLEILIQNNIINNTGVAYQINEFGSIAVVCKLL